MMPRFIFPTQAHQPVGRLRFMLFRSCMAAALVLLLGTSACPFSYEPLCGTGADIPSGGRMPYPNPRVLQFPDGTSLDYQVDVTTWEYPLETFMREHEAALLEKMDAVLLRHGAGNVTSCTHRGAVEWELMHLLADEFHGKPGASTAVVEKLVLLL